MPDLKGQFLMGAPPQNPDRAGYHFDLSGGDLVIHITPLPHQAGNRDRGLLIDIFDNRH